MPVIGIKSTYFWRRSTRPRLVFSHFGAAEGADLGQDAAESAPSLVVMELVEARRARA